MKIFKLSENLNWAMGEIAMFILWIMLWQEINPCLNLRVSHNRFSGAKQKDLENAYWKMHIFIVC